MRIDTVALLSGRNKGNGEKKDSREKEQKEEQDPAIRFIAQHVEGHGN
jgi:hypothetical protein